MGREEMCVPYCAVPCDDDDDYYDDDDLDISHCTDLPTFVNPSGCDCQCTCCDGGLPEEDDDDYPDYYYKDKTAKKSKSKKGRRLGMSSKMSGRSGGMYHSPKSPPPAQQCQCNCNCSDSPPPKDDKKSKDGSYPKGDKKSKDGSYPKDDKKSKDYKEKKSTYRYSLDEDPKTKKTPKAKTRGEKMKYPKYPLAKDHA